MNRFVWVLGTAALAVGAFVVGVSMYDAKKKESATDTVGSNQAALVRAHAPVYGSPTAKVTIVEFFDPACETCRAFYPIVKSMVNASFGQVNLVVRYAPFHQGSDRAVEILEAVRLQGKYWEGMEAALAAQPVWASHHAPNPELIWDSLGALGIDLAKAREDTSDPRIAEILAQDKKDVMALDVTRTPGFFVNGKPLTDFGANQLKAMVDQALRETSGK